MTLNTAVVAPMPKASDRSATAVNPACCRKRAQRVAGVLSQGFDEWDPRRSR